MNQEQNQNLERVTRPLRDGAVPVLQQEEGLSQYARQDMDDFVDDNSDNNADAQDDHIEHEPECIATINITEPTSEQLNISEC
jgi:hypothetical protein